ncbi:MAG: PilN domain-containing protein [Candidatus Magasanikiibacteriota bacterium]
MIPHRLNLLSPDKRNLLKRMVNFQFLKSLLEMILFFLSIFGIALLGGQWVLQDHFYAITGQINSVNNKYADKNQEIKNINRTLIQTEKIQNEYTVWTTKIAELTNIIPDGITLTGLSFDKNNKKINITGEAVSRNDLLLFKQNLESIQWINSVEVPPDQLIQKNKIQFSITPLMK